MLLPHLVYFITMVQQAVFQTTRCSMQHAPSPSCIFHSYRAACSILLILLPLSINLCKHAQILFRMQNVSNLHSMHSLHSSAILTILKLKYFIRGTITDYYFSSYRQFHFSSSCYVKSQKFNIIITLVQFNKD
jgi:hypothetical protein